MEKVKKNAKIIRTKKTRPSKWRPLSLSRRLAGSSVSGTQTSSRNVPQCIASATAISKSIWQIYIHHVNANKIQLTLMADPTIAVRTMGCEDGEKKEFTALTSALTSSWSREERDSSICPEHSGKCSSN